MNFVIGIFTSKKGVVMGTSWRNVALQNRRAMEAGRKQEGRSSDVRNEGTLVWNTRSPVTDEESRSHVYRGIGSLVSN